MQWLVATLALTLFVAGCVSAEPETAAPLAAVAEGGPAVDAAARSTSTTTTSVATTMASTTTTIVSTTTLVTTTIATTTTTTEAPTFSATVSEIDDTIAARMTSSWREGCPVGLDGLRHLELAHWDYDGRVAIGELVVAASVADDIVTVFAALFEAGFPIERMELVDVFDSDDDLSMAANNTSAFNCREVAWRPGVWSNHALGLAIDINPLVNPYVSSTRLLPPEGAAFTDRSLGVRGMILADDPVVRAFADIGWGWGGYWQSAKDYQHFSATGR